MPDTPPSREKLSKTPSWIMLGFVVGCIITYTILHNEGLKPASPPPPPVQKVEPTPAPSQDPQVSLQTMETIFLQYRERAVWRHDVTEVIFWNPQTNDYSIFAEVLRNGEDFYFRPISQLTRVVMDDLNDPNVPIRFTEPESARAARRGGPFFPAGK